MPDVFSPLKDQPHYIYRATGRSGSVLARIEQQLPGVLAYGHMAHDRRWYRMTKLLRETPAEPITGSDDHTGSAASRRQLRRFRCRRWFGGSAATS